MRLSRTCEQVHVSSIHHTATTPHQNRFWNLNDVREASSSSVAAFLMSHSPWDNSSVTKKSEIWDEEFFMHFYNVLEASRLHIHPNQIYNNENEHKNISHLIYGNNNPLKSASRVLCVAPNSLHIHSPGGGNLQFWGCSHSAASGTE